MQLFVLQMGDKGEGQDDLINLIEKDYQENQEKEMDWGRTTDYEF